MQPDDWRERLTDIQDATGRIFEYVRGLGFDDFALDQKTIDAVVRNLEIIGEAANYFSEEFRSGHP